MPTLILYPLAIIGLATLWSAPSWGLRSGAGQRRLERPLINQDTAGWLMLILGAAAGCHRPFVWRGQRSLGSSRCPPSTPSASSL